MRLDRTGVRRMQSVHWIHDSVSFGVTCSGLVWPQPAVALVPDLDVGHVRRRFTSLPTGNNIGSLHRHYTHVMRCAVKRGMRGRRWLAPHAMLGRNSQSPCQRRHQEACRVHVGSSSISHLVHIRRTCKGPKWHDCATAWMCILNIAHADGGLRDMHYRQLVTYVFS